MADSDFDFDFALKWRTFGVDCSLPVSDNEFKLEDIVDDLRSKMMVCGLKDNRTDKIGFKTDRLRCRIDVTGGKYYRRAVRDSPDFSFDLQQIFSQPISAFLDVLRHFPIF
jgi:hypothetical protein